MRIIKIVSEWKKKPTAWSKTGRKNHGLEKGQKLVQAIVDFGYGPVTRHIAISK